MFKFRGTKDIVPYTNTPNSVHCTTLFVRSSGFSSGAEYLIQNSLIGQAYYELEASRLSDIAPIVLSKAQAYRGMVCIYLRKYQEAEEIFTKLCRQQKNNHYLQAYLAFSMLCQDMNLPRDKGKIEQIGAVIAQIKEKQRKTQDAHKNPLNFMWLIMHVFLKKFFPFDNGYNFIDDLKELLHKWVTNLESITDINELTLICSILLSSRSLYDEAEYFLERLVPQNLEIRETDDARSMQYLTPQQLVRQKKFHYQYYYQMALNRHMARKDGDALKFCLLGTDFYGTLHVEMFQLFKACKENIFSSVLEETNRRAMWSVTQIPKVYCMKLVEYGIHSPREQFDFFAKITDYLEKQCCYYELRRFITPALSSRNSMLRGLYYMTMGNWYLFHGNLAAAQEQYRIASSNEKDASRKADYLLQYLIVILCRIYYRETKRKYYQHQIKMIQKSMSMRERVFARDKKTQIAELQKELNRTSSQKKEFRASISSINKNIITLCSTNKNKVFENIMNCARLLQAHVGDHENFDSCTSFQEEVLKYIQDNQKHEIMKTLLEAKGIILFYGMQYKKSKPYFDLLLNPYFVQPDCCVRLYMARVHYKYEKHPNNTMCQELIKDYPLAKNDIDLVRLHCVLNNRSRDKKDICGLSKLYKQIFRINSTFQNYDPAKNLLKSYRNQLCIALAMTIFDHMQNLGHTLEKKHYDILFHTFDKYQDLVNIFLENSILLEEKNLKLISITVLKAFQTKTQSIGWSICANIKQCRKNIMMRMQQLDFVGESSARSSMLFRSGMVYGNYASKLSHQQQTFCDLLKSCLGDAFIEAKAIASGTVQQPHTRITVFCEGIRGLSTTASLIPLPYVSKITAGITLGSAALQYSLLCIMHGNDKQAAVKIADLIPTPKHITELSTVIAKNVAIMFGVQLEKLATKGGIDLFALNISILLLNYIATDGGSNSTMFKKVRKRIGSMIKRTYTYVVRSIDKGLSPDKGENRDALLFILSGLFCEFSRKETKVLLKNGQQWPVESIIMRTGLRTPNGETYHNTDGKAEIFGYRLVPDELAQFAVTEWGYKKTDSQEECDQSSNCLVM